MEKWLKKILSKKSQIEENANGAETRVSDRKAAELTRLLLLSCSAR